MHPRWGAHDAFVLHETPPVREIEVPAKDIGYKRARLARNTASCGMIPDPLHIPLAGRKSKVRIRLSTRNNRVLALRIETDGFAGFDRFTSSDLPC